MNFVKKIFGRRRQKSDITNNRDTAIDLNRRKTIGTEKVPPAKEEVIKDRRAAPGRPTSDSVDGKAVAKNHGKLPNNNVAMKSSGRNSDYEDKFPEKKHVAPFPARREAAEGEKAPAVSAASSPVKRTSSPILLLDDEFVEPPHIAKAYASIPILEQTKLPRGGCSVETKAVGRVQFGIPPETIKDSMKLGIPVPQVYIVPVERFCREMGPALGVNLAEFEFPAYFNYFVYKKRCTLVVDSSDAEDNIRRVFSETLLGPGQFRREEDGIPYEEEDFAPDFPRDAIPNFQKELQHFRIMPDGHELVIETLLEFRHFELSVEHFDSFGFLPPVPDDDPGTDGASMSLREIVCVDEETEESVPQDENGVEKREKENSPWTYTQTKEMGDVARVYPFHATPEQIKAGGVPRVEIFKMPGGTEYIVHDIDENNIIIGKARFSGHVRVSESMRVDGFGGLSITDDLNNQSISADALSKNFAQGKKMKSFHPPSFGVTILGNSHGFDKSGSVSGYVLWINGRGVMIDPPPYSSATLEREGIRPRTIVGIILTHCHADHDAGAFQKVLTGSPVVVITTPTIYKSFIRKYAALSALSPALLRHSHRYKPAIIGEPLRFQGATFNFIYTLHTIPCVGFRVEWRGRSMVFTGDHFNNPEAIEKLQETGVLSKARADDLKNLPLQDTDLLLHEAGAPPIHTPLEVLLKLPQRVKQRLYVVHTSALPPGCELRVAPTGTAGTIRLDQNQRKRFTLDRSASVGLGEDDYLWTTSSEYATTITEDPDPYSDVHSSLVGFNPAALPGSGKKHRQNSVFIAGPATPVPLVSLRPASSTDAWFILNLLSAVPFLSSLSYSSTMEVLETARVDAYSLHDIVVPAERRSKVLCVIWEGTCAEQPATPPNRRGNKRIGMKSMSAILLDASEDTILEGPVWHAGDWTGPIALQPEEALSGESATSKTHDIVVMSAEGAKVITIDFPGLHTILKSGSPLYRRFLERMADRERALMNEHNSERDLSATEVLLEKAMKNLNVLELLNCNSALRKLTAIQKRHLESLTIGPLSYAPGERLWVAGSPVDKAFIIISGTASFVQKRRMAGSAAAQMKMGNLGDPGVGESMKYDAETAIKELGVRRLEHHDAESTLPLSLLESEEHSRSFQGSIIDMSAHDYAQHDYATLKGYLQKDGSVGSGLSGDSISHEDGEVYEIESEVEEEAPASRRGLMHRRRSSRARQVNKVLGRLYSRRAFTGGLVFSRGHFLGDVSKMVAGLLSSDVASESGDSGPEYGFGDKPESANLLDNLPTITEAGENFGNYRSMHSSTLTAGPTGCVVLMLPKSSLIPFLDEYPGLLLSLLGTQVVV